MEDGSIGFIVALVVLVALSAFFSASETAFSTFNSVRVKNLAGDGDKKAALVLKLACDYNKLLSTILVGNNIVNLTAASIATVLFVKHFGDIGATLSTIVITVAVLIFGEISPKTLAKESPESFAMFAAPMLRALEVVLTPVNWLFTQWKKLLSRVFKASDRSMTEEELMSIVEEAGRDGAIEKKDEELIHNVIEFNDLTAREILTPRVDMEAIEKDMAEDEIADVFIATGYSRLPVYDDSLDHILGVIHLRDFFEGVRGHKSAIEDILTPVVFISPTVKISDLLKLLQSQKSHLAVVTDEHGGTSGIVTMEDVLEELVGEIWDEHDDVIESVLPLPNGAFRVVGGMETGKMFEHFDIDTTTRAATVSGWISEMLGRLPAEGDSFVYGGWRVTVTKADHRRVLECEVAKAPEEAKEE